MKNQKWIVLLVILAMSTMAYSQVGMVDCNPPEQSAVTRVDLNSANFAWTPGEETSSWVIEVGLRGFTPGNNSQTNVYYFDTEKILPRLTKKLSGLEMNVMYDVYIRSACRGTGNSLWIGPITFKTQSNIGVN